MGKLTEWVKLNVKDGANIAEFEELERVNTFEGVTDKNKALEIIKKDGSVFKSALDTAIQDAVSSHDAKFQTEKLPNILETERKKIKDELNPPKTEEQKRIAEMQNTIDAMTAKDKRLELESILRTKAKEFGYPEERASRFAVYGESAEEQLKQEAEFYKTHIKTEVEKEGERIYGKQKPPQSSKTDPSKVMGRSDFETLTPKERQEFFTNGGDVTD